MIRFSKYIWLYFLVSASVLVPGIYALARYGLRAGVDFTGGTLYELTFSTEIRKDAVENAAREAQVDALSIQKTGNTAYLLRTKPNNEDKLKIFYTKISEGRETPEIIRDETVGPVLGKELLVKALIASGLAVLTILGYVAYAFKNIKYGVSAVLALFHDLLVVLGSFALFGWLLNVEVDTLFVTAVLTTMSFSVHDTIVVFDRIREYVKEREQMSYDVLADRALTETMGRSLTNSFTIIFMLLALVLLGGDTIRWFAVALLIGTISGTYSSPFIATPILLLWDRWEKKRA